MPNVRAALIILGKDLRLRIRDRSAFIIGIVAPLGLALILNQVVGDFGNGEFSATFGIVDQDHGPATSQFLEAVEQVPGVEVRGDLSEREARAQVDDGELDAAFLIPEGLSAAAIDVDGPAPPEIVVIGNADSQLGAQIATSFADRFAAGIDAGRLSVALVSSSGRADPAVFEEAFAQQPPVALGQLPAENRELDKTTYLIAGLGVLFLFFLVQFGVAGLLEERQDGTLSRLLAAPIHPITIPGAKALTSVVLGLIGMTALALVSTVFLGADWGDPLTAAVLIVAVVLAAVSFVMVVVGLARTAEQASNAQSVIAMVLGLLGGAFFPVSQGDSIVSRLAVLTPHHWFLQGLGDGLAGGLGDALDAVAALLTFAVVMGTAGVVLLRRGTWRQV